MSSSDSREAVLVLEDGRAFPGWAFGAHVEAAGEVCFNTSMTGYQEVLTDPSYRGQIVCMTYPLIGNYGVNAADAESRTVHARGLIVRELSPLASSHLSEETLDAYLERHGVTGITGLDTRALTRHLRDRGSLRGVIAVADAPGGLSLETEDVARRARAVAPLESQDLVGEVTTPERFDWTESVSEQWLATDILPSAAPGIGPRVIAMDFGIKRGMLRGLVRSGARVTVVPARTPARDILALRPDGVFLSNGPGDPATLGDIVEETRRLVERVPVFGICLGHQILGQVFGAKTYKLKFGHRGGNHPVKDITTGKIEITTQNHGYAVDADTLSEHVMPTHVNLNDHTLEGLAHRELPVFSVQYHPEASPGPHDAYYLFQRFMTLMRDRSLAT